MKINVHIYECKRCSKKFHTITRKHKHEMCPSCGNRYAGFIKTEIIKDAK